MECPACHAPVVGNATFCASCGGALPKATEGRIGSVLAGRYRIVSKIGEGGMGAVWVAEQQMGTKTRKVAVKTLHENLSQDPSIRERFQRECAIVSELEHPHTIQVFDFGTAEDGTLYIVMELAQGRSLADEITKSGALNPVRAKAILTQIASALGEAHNRGIIHRDLKPDNVLLTDRAGETDFVKLLDFGIAKRSQEDPNEAKLTQTGTVIGTPPYMSPEQFTGQALSPRSDIYSLGVLAYEMVTGKLPFQVEQPWQWATKHMTETPAAIESTPRGAEVPDAMRRAIMRALEKSPDARFATTKEFSDALSTVPRVPTAADVPVTVPEGAKGRTQIGEAYVPPAAAFVAPQAAYGASPPQHAPGYDPNYAANPGFGTPAPGAVAYGAVPQAGYASPAQSYVAAQHTAMDGGGGSKKGLLIAAAVVGVLSIGAIAFALKGSSSTPAPVAPVVDLAPTSVPTATPAAAAPTETPAAPLGNTGVVAPLSPGRPASPAGPTTPKPAAADAGVPVAPPAAPATPQTGPVTPAPTLTLPPPTPATPKTEPKLPQPTPPPATPPPATPAAPTVPRDCVSAANAKARGITGPSYDRLVERCRAAGGTPP